MNESMNFGNIGFNDTTANSSQQNTNAEVQNPTEAQANPQNGKPDLLAGVGETEEEKQTIKDFQNTETKKTNYDKDADNFSQIDFGPLQKYLDDDDITDISYSNNGQLWLKSLSKGVYRADQQDVNNELIEKIAFQCSNIMGKTFNMAHPFLDSESAELRMNFVHDSIARNGIAVVFRKTPAKIRLEKQKLLNEKYIRLSIHDFLINCVKGHCNIIVCGETGSGKTELIKYLAAHTAENEKIITIEDTLELHLDRIFPQRDIVAMKTNNIASYSDVLVTCMRQNPIWILLSEVRSAEAVTAVRNSISSGHYILSTIHADKAESIPHRMYSLLESNIDVEQFLKTIYRYVQIGVFVRGRYKAEEKRFVREIAGVCEFFVTDDTNEPKFNNIYLKTVSGEETYTEPTKYIKNYLEGQGVDVTNLFGEKMSTLEEANKANGINEEVHHSSFSEGKKVEPKKEIQKIDEEKKEEKETPKLKLADIGSNTVHHIEEAEKLDDEVVEENLQPEPQVVEAAPVVENPLPVQQVVEATPVVENPLPVQQVVESAPVVENPLPVQQVVKATPVVENPLPVQQVVQTTPVVENPLPVQQVVEATPVVENPLPVQQVVEAAPVVENPLPVQQVVESAPVVENPLPVQQVVEAAPVVENQQPVQQAVATSPKSQKTGLEILMQPTNTHNTSVISAPQEQEIVNPNMVGLIDNSNGFNNTVDVLEAESNKVIEPKSLADSGLLKMPTEHLIPLPSQNNNVVVGSSNNNVIQSVDNQLMGAPSLTSVQEKKPTLINKPGAKPNAKPFAKQKFFSGTIN